LQIRPSKVSFEVIDNAELAIDASRQDWDNFETSWDFQSCPLLGDRTIHQLSQTFTTWKTKSEQAFQQLKQLEEQNHLLQDEIRSRELVQSALRISEATSRARYSSGA